jgi:hypothetical protein
VQADVDAAFRRIPIAKEHRWACGVAFVVDGQVMVSQHAACPFGAVASVHAWERVGAAITHIARVFLKLAALRYVDDFFAPERCACNGMTLLASRAACMQLPQAEDHEACTAVPGQANQGAFGAHSSCCWQVGMRQKPGRARGKVLLEPACALNSCPGMVAGHENVKAGLQVPAQRKQGS